MATYLFMDVDGVVIKGYHHKPEYRRHWDEHIERDLGISKGALQTHFFDPHMRDITTGKRALLEVLTDALPHLGYKGSAQDIVDYWFKADSVLDIELLSLLGAIKARTDARLYLATNQEKTRAGYLWNELKLGHLFIDIYFSGRLGVGKSDPAFFTMVNQQLELDPDSDEILFFDDAPGNIIVAREAGWLAFQYDTIRDFSGNPYIQRLLGAQAS